MAKSIAELRTQHAQHPQASPSRPERAVTVCLAPHLVAEVQSLTAEQASLVVHPREDGQPSGPPRRAGQGDPPRLVEIRERLTALLDEMAEHEGELRVRANPTDGEWRRWVNEHPARAEGKPGHDRDAGVTYGICNADDLLDDLATYAHTWNGDPLADGEFATLIEPNLATADKSEMARSVVSMYESRLDFPRLRSDLSANQHRFNGSTSPTHSGSPTSGSTGGSPEPSSADSTSKATE